MKKITLKIIFLAVTIILLSMTFSCYADDNSMLTVKADTQTITAKPDKATIVFLRPRQNVVKGLILADPTYVGIHDISGSETKFLTALMTEEKFVYEVDPGEYIFMVTTDIADFLKAKVVSGKIYYVTLHSRISRWESRYSFYPQRHENINSEEFREYNEQCIVVVNHPSAEQWATKKGKNVEHNRREYWPKWLELSQEKQNEMTLNPEDGI